jgi:glycosyltransferase involved in cell wall biosynthesis
MNISAELDISVVVPAYDEYESIPLLHEQITQVMQPLDLSYQIVYVDDGSTDGTTELLHTIYDQDTHVGLVIQRRNFGKSLALNAGFAMAQGRVIITMDADLQDDPAEITRLLAELDKGHDLVVGWKQDRQDPASKTIPSWIANRTTRMMTGVRIHDMNCGLKAYRAECAKHLQLYGDMHRYIPALAHYQGFRVTEIPVKHHKRRFGRSKYGIGRLLRGGLDLLTVLFLGRFSRRPLHLFGIIGGVMLTMGLMINLALSIEWFAGASKPLSERPVLILGVLLMLMGVQLVTTGLLAELIVAHMERSQDPLNTAAKIKPSREEESEHEVGRQTETETLASRVDRSRPG